MSRESTFLDKRVGSVKIEWLYALFFLTLFVVAQSVIHNKFLNEKSLHLMFLGLLFGCLLIPWVLNRASNLLLEWCEYLPRFAKSDSINIREYAIEQAEFFYKPSIKAWFCALFLGSLSGLAYYNGDVFGDSTRSTSLLLSIITAAFALPAGFCLYLLYRFSKLFVAIGNIPDLRIDVSLHPYGILGVGVVLSKTWLYVGCIWAAYVSSALLIPEVLKGAMLPILMLSIPSFILLVTLFLFAQSSIHNKMSDYKRMKILELDELIQTYDLNDLSQETRDRYRFLVDRRDEYRLLPIWPMSALSTARGLGFSTVTAISPFIVVKYLEDFLSFVT